MLLVFFFLLFIDDWDMENRRFELEGELQPSLGSGIEGDYGDSFGTLCNQICIRDFDIIIGDTVFLFLIVD